MVPGGLAGGAHIDFHECALLAIQAWLAEEPKGETRRSNLGSKPAILEFRFSNLGALSRAPIAPSVSEDGPGRIDPNRPRFSIDKPSLSRQGNIVI
jgi:hypothetical protein